MSMIHLAILALIQGVTEFLPISSSAHLILFPRFAGTVDQGLTIDVAVHVGTLFAVLVYFRAEFADVLSGVFRIATGDVRHADSRLTLLLALATIPVLILGIVFALTGLADLMRSIEVIAWTTIIWGAALWVADARFPTLRSFGDWRLRDAVLMGLAQALAIVPGTSRSGITMTMARALGFGRVDAARLSMLMSAPAIGAAGGYAIMKLVASGDFALGLDALIAAALSFAAALAALAVMMRMLKTWTMTPFVLYRFGLGALLLWMAYA